MKLIEIIFQDMSSSSKYADVKTYGLSYWEV